MPDSNCEVPPLNSFLLGMLLNLLSYFFVCLSVTLSGPPFRGFLLEARNAEDLSGPPIGSFTLIDSQVSQLLTCEDVQVCVVSETGICQFLWIFSLQGGCCKMNNDITHYCRHLNRFTMIKLWLQFSYLRYIFTHQHPRKGSSLKSL